MSEDENNVDRSSGVPIDTRVGTNSKKTRTPHVIPITDSSPALENVYQSFRIVVKLYAFQTTNVTGILANKTITPDDNYFWVCCSRGSITILNNNLLCYAYYIFI